MKTISDRDISKYSFGVTGHSRSYRDSSADFSFHSIIDCLAMKLDENEMLCFFFWFDEISVWRSWNFRLLYSVWWLTVDQQWRFIARVFVVWTSGRVCLCWETLFIFYFKINGELVSNATCRSNKWKMPTIFS